MELPNIKYVHISSVLYVAMHIFICWITLPAAVKY